MNPNGIGNENRCYVCGGGDFSDSVEESPIEERFGLPVLPADAYRQKRCRNCGLLFVDCDVTDEYLASLYSRESVDWQLETLEASSVADTVGQTRIPEFESVWSTAIKLRPAEVGDKLLDYGSQTGEFGKIAMERSEIEPFGIELSPDYATKCRVNWNGKGKVHVGSIESSDFHDGGFAYISAQEVLEHLVDPRGSLKEFHKIIKDNGIIIVTVPSSHYFIFKFVIFKIFSNLNHLFRRSRSKNLGQNSRRVLVHTHLYNFTPTSLDLMLNQTGFVAMHITGIGWHGKLRILGNVFGRIIWLLSFRRLSIYPSLLYVGKKHEN